MRMICPLAAVLVAVMAPPLLAGTLYLSGGSGGSPLTISPTLVSIPDAIPGYPGTIAMAPVEIDDAAGVYAANIDIAYDTDLLDLSDADVKTGTLTSDWTLVPNVDDALGLAKVAVFGTLPLPGGSGSLIELDFHVTADSGVAALTPSGYLNEDIFPDFDPGSIDIVPEPSALVLLMSLFAAVSAVVLLVRKCR